MKVTKYRLQKIINSSGQQTKKRYKMRINKQLHTNTVRNKKQFNLRNNTLKNWSIL
jgi:hypothetical protein